MVRPMEDMLKAHMVVLIPLNQRELPCSFYPSKPLSHCVLCPESLDPQTPRVQRKSIGDLPIARIAADHKLPFLHNYQFCFPRRISTDGISTLQL